MQLRSNTEGGRRGNAAKPRAMRGGRFAALRCSDDGDDSTGDDDGDDDDDASGDEEPASKWGRWAASNGGSPGSETGAAVHRRCDHSPSTRSSPFWFVLCKYFEVPRAMNP